MGRARFQMGDSFFDVFTELKVGGTHINWVNPPDPVRLTSGLMGPPDPVRDSFFDVFFDVQVSTDGGRTFGPGTILRSDLSQGLNLSGPPDPVKSFFDVFFEVEANPGPPTLLALEALFVGPMITAPGTLMFDSQTPNMLQLDPPFHWDTTFEIRLQAVPEPSALLLMASGLAAAGWLGRRRPPQGRR